MYRHALKTAVVSSTLMCMAAGSASALDHVSFDMVVSAGASTCLPNASAKVRIESVGTAEEMFIFASGLPPKTEFDLFVIQVPKSPFGLSWYQGDLQTDRNGEAFQVFRGRFSIETFIVAPGIAPAPQVFSDDAAANPMTAPVQTYHLGLWFNSPADAQKAGCAGTVTPFNGEHNAGIQVLNTSNFPDTQGPLFNVQP